MLLRVLCRSGQAANRARGSSLVLAIAEREGPGAPADLQAFFGCGWIRESKADRTFKYEARAVGDLLDPIVPHFERHPLRGAKARSFGAFADVCGMIEQGDHLRRDGVRAIVDIAYEMNLGKRRLTHDELLRALHEVKG